MPRWSADDQAFARAVQQANQRKVEPLKAKVSDLLTPENPP